VTEPDVADALREKGFEVQTKHIVMPSHLRMLGEHEVTLVFAEDLSTVVTVTIIRPEDEAGESESEQQSEQQSDDAPSN